MKQTAGHLAQKYFYFAAFIVATVVLSCVAQAAPQYNLGPNLVKNAGFESGAEHWNLGQNLAEVVNGVASSGEHSMRYINTDPSQYKLFTQNVDVKPGQRLHYSAWIKGENINGPDKHAAGAFMESYEGSKYIGGSFSIRTQPGTFDWQHFSSIYVVPPNVTRVSVGLYLRKGATGTAWFDDVEVREEIPAPFSAHLQYPNYRGMVTQNSSIPWKTNIRINKQENWKTGPVTIVHTIKDSDGNELAQNSSSLTATDGIHEVTIPTPNNLSIGHYKVTQTIIDPNGDEALQEEYPIQIVNEMPKVYVDHQGFTVVDGERFFPLGVYTGKDTSEGEHLERISKGGFNTVLSYQYGRGENPEKYLDEAHQHGLNVVYAINRFYPGYRNAPENSLEQAAEYIQKFRDHPALLAWYTNDEMNVEWLPKIAEMYEQVKQLDPNHPTFQVQDKITIIPQYFDFTDILGTDPYPVGEASLARTSRNIRSTYETTRDIKGMWIVPQLMDWGVYRELRDLHQPSLDEMRNQAYQAIINGATGLIFYTYYDLMFEDYPRGPKTTNMELFEKRWADASQMAEEINQIVPVILQGDNKVPLERPEDAEVEANAWEHNNELLIMLANPYYEQKELTIPLPQGWKVDQTTQNDIQSTLNDGNITFTLPSVGSGIFRLVKN